jgi:hypothetical protein
VLSVLAAFAAIFLFLPWALDRRRRPEARFLWKISGEGNSGVSWSPCDAQPIQPGQRYEVSVGIQNIGDRAPENALINFVVPDCLTLENANSPEQRAAPSENETAGMAPLHRVLFLTPSLPSSWTPGNFFLYRFTISYADDSALALPVELRLLFAIADARFNATGKRWLPSLVSAVRPAYSPAGSPWPPTVAKRRRRLKLITAGSDVLCTRGERQVVRDVEVRPHTTG